MLQSSVPPGYQGHCLPFWNVMSEHVPMRNHVPVEPTLGLLVATTARRLGPPPDRLVRFCWAGSMLAQPGQRAVPVTTATAVSPIWAPRLAAVWATIIPIIIRLHTAPRSSRQPRSDAVRFDFTQQLGLRQEWVTGYRRHLPGVQPLPVSGGDPFTTGVDRSTTDLSHLERVALCWTGSGAATSTPP